MTEQLPKMNSAKVSNTHEGILVIGQDEAMLFSVGNATKLRDQLNDALAVAKGYQLRRLTAEEVEPRTKIVIADNEYVIKNVLMERDEKFVVQWDDEYGEESEMRVAPDFEIFIMEVIE